MRKTVLLALVSLMLSFFTVSAFASEYKGKIEVINLNGLKLHSYNSPEGMLDGSAIFETDKGLVLLEPQSMPASEKELKSYIDSLGKPLEAIIVSYHGGGLKPYKGVPVYSSQAVIDWSKDGGAKALYDHFASTVPGFDPTVIVPDHVIKGDKINIGGIDFAILNYHDVADPVPGFTISIPSAKVVYLHTLGGTSHSIINTVGDIDLSIKELEGLKGKYDLIITSHHAPEKAQALDQKIAYFKKTKEIANASKTREEFINAMKKAFPNHKGEGYLEITAASFYKAPQAKNNLSEIDYAKILAQNPLGVFATREGEGVQTRIFQCLFTEGHRVYFCTSSEKDVYRQLTANPQVSFCTWAPDYSPVLSVNGKALFVDDLKLKTRALDENPSIKDIYKTPDNPVFKLLYIDVEEIKTFSFSEGPKSYRK